LAAGAASLSAASAAVLSAIAGRPAHAARFFFLLPQFFRCRGGGNDCTGLGCARICFCGRRCSHRFSTRTRSTVKAHECLRRRCQCSVGVASSRDGLQNKLGKGL
jgi:hypothetical protein